MPFVPDDTEENRRILQSVRRGFVPDNTEENRRILQQQITPQPSPTAISTVTQPIEPPKPIAERAVGVVRGLTRATRETIEPPTTIETSKRLLSPLPGRFGLGRFAEERAAEVERVSGGPITEQLINRLPETPFGQRFPKTTAAVGALAEVARPIVPGSLRPSAIPAQLTAEAAGAGLIKGGIKGIKLVPKIGKGIIRGLKRIFKKPSVSPSIAQIPPQVTASVIPGKQVSQQELSQALVQPPRQIGALEKANVELSQSGARTLEKQGPTGEVLKDSLQSWRRNWQVRSGQDKVKVIPELEKLTPIEKESFVVFMNEGKITPGLSSKAKQIADITRTLTNATGDILEQLSKETGFRVQTQKGKRLFFQKKNFFPNEPDMDILGTPEGRLDEIRHLVNTKQVSSVETATEIVDLIIKRRSPQIDQEAIKLAGLKFPRVAKEIKGERVFNLKNIIRDPVVAYDRFFDRIHKTIARLEQFGANDEILVNQLADIAKTGGDAISATKIADGLLGRTLDDRDLSRMIGTLRGIQGIKLSLSFVKNAPQGFVNSWIRTRSFKSATKGFFNAIKNREGARELAQSAGAIANEAHRKYISSITGQAIQGKRSKFLEFSLKAFNASETANRIVAASIGEEYVAKNLVPKFLKNPTNKILRKELKGLGIDAAELLKRKGQLTEKETLGAVNEFVRQTQFGADELELPIFWTTAYGKLLTQYKSFSFNQGKLLKNMMKIDPLGTTSRLAIISTLVGIPVNKLSKALRGQFKTEKEQDNFLDEVLQGFMTIGGLGVISDVTESAKFGKQGLLGFIGGPTAGTIASIGTPLAKGDVQEVARQGLRQFVPFVGPAASELLRKEKPSSKSPF